ncbi:MAG: tetratricopeptide repeat protein [Actinobacteria bacterium]|nr:tetratricopeptide repeat protein [Actinomycetota bacterium]
MAGGVAGLWGLNLKRVAIPIVSAALILTAIFLQMGIEIDRMALGLETTGVESTASTALKFLGGLRSAAAAYIWIKVDRLHDEYYGEKFEQEEELIPLYRITTWLDPHLVDAYYVGSYLLYKFKRTDEGWSFAMEGLRLNPESAKMELNVGQLALFYRKDYRDAITHLERACLIAKSTEEKIFALQTLEAAYRQAGMIDRAESVKRAIPAANTSISKPAAGSLPGSTPRAETGSVPPRSTSPEQTSAADAPENDTSSADQNQ